MNVNDLPKLRPSVSPETTAVKEEKKAKVAKTEKKAAKAVKKTEKKVAKAERKAVKKEKKVTKASGGFLAAIVLAPKPVKPELTNPVEVRAFVIAKAAAAFNKINSAKAIKKSIVDTSNASIKNAVSASISDTVVADVRTKLASKLASKIDGIAAKAEKAATNAKKPLDKAALDTFAVMAESVVDPSFSKNAKKTASPKPAKADKPAAKATKEKATTSSKVKAKVKKSAPKKKSKK